MSVQLGALLLSQGKTHFFPGLFKGSVRVVLASLKTPYIIILHSLSEVLAEASGKSWFMLKFCSSRLEIMAQFTGSQNYL